MYCCFTILLVSIAAATRKQVLELLNVTYEWLGSTLGAEFTQFYLQQNNVIVTNIHINSYIPS